MKKTKDPNKSFATKTPEKPKQLPLRSKKPSTSHSSKSKSAAEIPQKYEILVEFFNCMESSIRLLGLKRSVPTFENICSSIQHLTGRRFTHGHLAQLMYILPEAISIRKVLLRDESTCCMKPELQVYLVKEERGYQVLRGKFRKRIVKFSRKHPEADVPKEMLPHPFGHQTETKHPSTISRSSVCTAPTKSMSPTKSIADNHQFVTPSTHTGPSFKRHFSHKSMNHDVERSSLACYKKDTQKNKTAIQNEVNASHVCHLEDHHPSNTTHKSYTISTSKLTLPVKPTFASPFNAYASSSDKNSTEKSNSNARTPENLLSTPATPDVQATKRHSFEISCDIPKKEVDMEKRSARAKLFGSPQKCAETNELDDSENISISVSEDDDDDDVISILPSNILQQIKEKERQREEERVRVSFKAKKYKEMVASLPKLIDMIHLIFQSGNQSSVPKHELVNKLTAGYHSTFDRSEVEQQLGLLQEFVPGWISLKLVSGASLYSLDKSSVPEEIRQKLAEAI